MTKKIAPLLAVLFLGACCNYGIFSLRGYAPQPARPAVAVIVAPAPVAIAPAPEPSRTQQTPDFIKRTLAPEPTPASKKPPVHDPLDGS